MVLRVLLEMGYQCSVAVVQAASQGVPQSRTRTIFIASAPGHELPLHPRPLHTFKRSDHRYSVHFSIGRSNVGLTPRQDSRLTVEVTATPHLRTPSAPLRFVRVRDTLTDLPPIANGVTELSSPKSYGQAPSSPYQAQLRMMTPRPGKKLASLPGGRQVGHDAGGSVETFAGTEDTTGRLAESDSLLSHHVCREMHGLEWQRAVRVPRNHPGADWRDLPNEPVNIQNAHGANIVVPPMAYLGRDEDAIAKFGLHYPEIARLDRAVCACMSIKSEALRKQLSGSQECRKHMRESIIPWGMPHTATRHNQWLGVYGRLIAGGSSATIVTNPALSGKQGTWLHPSQDRIISVREAARLQGFPDHFSFAGGIHMMYKQIGNAVPPPLGRAIALAVAGAERHSSVRRAAEMACEVDAAAGVK
jgi:DNA (cytosine-5)-methyltransferase 1